MKRYFVYILASRTRVLYTGITGDLFRRTLQHKNKATDGFTSRYKVKKLVFYEETNDVRKALAREKQIKGWLRKKKVALIELVNPNWEDLTEKWR